MIPTFIRRWCAVLLVLAPAVLPLAGCSSGGGDKPTEPEVPTPPVANSPTNAVRLLEWCWDHRDAAKYREVFTNDYQYDFAPSDSQNVSTTLDRDEELQIATSLFAAAQSVVMELDPTLSVQNDSRPGKNARYHKEIVSSVRLSVNQSGANDYSTAGSARFFLTRGDSAQIPAELLGHGFTADSTHWYVDRWSDASAACDPGKVCVTVGRIKLAFASGPVGPRRAGN